MRKFLFTIFLISLNTFTLPCYARIIFLHIPKTAGTTTHHILESNFNSQNIYPLRATDFLTFLPEQNFDNCPMINQELVSGHFPFFFLKEKDPEFDKSFLFTVLRDPVERVLSQWTHFHYSKGSPVDVRPNTMCLFLCSDVTLKGDDLLKDAIKSLRRMNFIVFQDDYENGMKTLCSKLKLNIPNKEIPFKNLHPNRKEVSDETIEEIKRLNALDIRLYKYADKKLRKKFLPKKITLQNLGIFIS